MNPKLSFLLTTTNIAFFYQKRNFGVEFATSDASNIKGMSGVAHKISIITEL